MNNYYEGMVSMKPEMEARHFFSGDCDFTYQIPKVYFECVGEVENFEDENPLKLGFDWRGDSMVVVKDNRAVRYTEYDYYELLMADLDGKTEWKDGRLVDIIGWDLDQAKDIRKAKSYMIEEYDWNSSLKRRYKVILEETSKLEAYDNGYLKKIIDENSKSIGDEYILTDPDREQAV